MPITKGDILYTEPIYILNKQIHRNKSILVADRGLERIEWGGTA